MEGMRVERFSMGITILKHLLFFSVTANLLRF